MTYQLLTCHLLKGGKNMTSDTNFSDIFFLLKQADLHILSFLKRK